MSPGRNDGILFLSKYIAKAHEPAIQPPCKLTNFNILNANRLSSPVTLTNDLCISLFSKPLLLIYIDYYI